MVLIKVATKGICVEGNKEDVFEALWYQNEVSVGIATYNWYMVNQDIIFNNN
jgi:hypothetical protein